MASRNRLQVFTAAGGALGQGPEIMGVGRILRTCPGWIAAATDRYFSPERRALLHAFDLER